MRSVNQPLVYVVDDDPDEHHLLQTVFGDHHTDCALRCFSDGTELVTQLTHQLDGRLPDLILLDWHMSILGGAQILQLLKDDDQWRSIPVVIRSCSKSRTAINSSYNLGAQAFIVKGSSYQQLAESIKSLLHTWLN